MGVNWKRGLIRSWAVVSLVWIVGVVILVGPSTFGLLPDLPETVMIEKSIELARAYLNGAMPSEKKEYYEEALRRGLLVGIQSVPGRVGEMQIALKDETIIKNVPSDIEAKEVGRRITNYFQERRTREIKNRILKSSGLLFVPPFVLLTMGVALYWVFLGFKKST